VSVPAPRIITIDEFTRRAERAGDEPLRQRRRPGRALRFLNDAELMATPDIEWAISGRIVADSLVLLAGASGIGKTFVALDCALSIVTGLPWLGASVQRSGPAVYLAADGSAAGLKTRVRHWKDVYGYPLDESLGLFVLPEPVNLGKPPDLDSLIAGMTPMMPALVVVDTLARTMTGLDENSARDVGNIVDALDRLRRATHSSVIVIHHTGLGAQDRERGSSAIRAAVDTVLMLSDQGGPLRLSCAKQRDAAPFAPVAIELIDDHHGRHLVRLATGADLASDPDLHHQIASVLRTAGTLSGSAIARTLHGDRARIFAALDAMRRTGVLTVSIGPRKANLWSLAAPVGDLNDR
jgi:hypothetical protein